MKQQNISHYLSIREAKMPSRVRLWRNLLAEEAGGNNEQSELHGRSVEVKSSVAPETPHEQSETIDQSRGACSGKLLGESVSVALSPITPAQAVNIWADVRQWLKKEQQEHHKTYTYEEIATSFRNKVVENYHETKVEFGGEIPRTLILVSSPEEEFMVFFVPWKSVSVKEEEIRQFFPEAATLGVETTNGLLIEYPAFVRYRDVAMKNKIESRKTSGFVSAGNSVTTQPAKLKKADSSEE